MKISLSWLRDYLRTDKTASEIARILTDAGLEVGAIESTGVAIPKVVAAQILESIQHPNADRLSVCKVDDGSGTPRQIVCGAKNYKVGDKVPLAQPGAVMPGDFKIKVGKLRGVESEGMMCSSKELGLGEGADGLLILSPDTTIGTPLSELFPAEEVFEIEITPNRPDWLGHLGVAREAAAFGCGELVACEPDLPAAKENASVAAITAPAVASFYCIRRIDGVNVGPSPEWLRKRLESVGLRPINNIVDVTNFVMFETAQPLHAFDATKIDGALTVRFANEGEAFTALDGKEHKLSANDPVIADDKGPQAVAGITGGAASGVSETTTSVLLESAVFTPTVIRRSSRSLGISTDSSYRFERGVDAQGALTASARAAALIVEVAGGTLSSESVVAGSLPASPVVSLRGERVRALLGIDLDDAVIASQLAKLGIKQASGGFEIPSWRNDLAREVDLIEEVARLHGIGNIVSSVQGIPSHSSEADRAYDFARGLRRRLSGGGFHEARSGTLTGSRDQAAYAFGGSSSIVAVRNPMGEEHSTLRASLIPGLLEAVSRNLRHGADTIRLFEIGKVYQQQQPEESVRLGLVMTGRTEPENWRGKKEGGGERAVDLFDLKGVIARLCNPLEPITFRPAIHASLPHLPLALDILIAGKPVGVVGVLSPATTREVTIGGHQGQIVVAELDLGALQASNGIGFAKDPKRFGAIPKFPAIRRDLALLLDASTPYSLIEETALGSKEELLSSITPFDIFSDAEGVKVPLGKKSLAVALTFQHPERTLTTEDVNEALARIVTRLRESADAEIRG
jgi:phenylalanyl-tRNA synthetase beta chain